jgi:bacteriorhodopsin
MNSLYISKLLAYFIQIISTIIVVYTFFQDIPLDNLPLKQVLGIESIVQIVQVIVYTILILQFNLANMASTRYLDWIITTPLMLLAFIIYLNYENDTYNNTQIDTLNNFITENKNYIYIIFIANGLMLLLGLLGEFKYISKTSATIGGFIALLIVFGVIYKKYASKSKKSTLVFIPFVSIWSIYGIAYNFNENNKNFTYNILDTIAKNIFGLFISYNVLNIQ